MKKTICLLFCLLTLFLTGCSKNTASLSENSFFSHFESTHYYTTSIVGTFEEASAVSSDESKTSQDGNPSSQNSVINPAASSAASQSSKVIDTATSTSAQTPISSSSEESKIVSAPTSATATYYCYEKLTASQKEIYNKIRDAAFNMTVGMIELGSTTPRDISVAYKAVRNDHPEYFWMPYAFLKKKTTTDSSETWAIAMQHGEGQDAVSYLCTPAERTVMEAALKEKINKIRTLIPSGTSDYEAQKIVHDWICENVVYTTDNGSDEQIYTAYGALVNGKALCEGYSRAMQLLCNNLSIPCTLVCGTSKQEPHMWNIIQINKEWYHLDVTWNDATIDGTTPQNVILHNYFNLTDNEISATHKIERDIAYVNDSEFSDSSSDPNYNISLPVCRATQYSYVTKEGNTLPDIKTDADTVTAQNVINNVLKNAVKGEKTYCEFFLGYNVAENVDLNALCEKYPLQNCFNDVNSICDKKIKTDSFKVSLSGRTFVIFFEYEGE